MPSRYLLYQAILKKKNVIAKRNIPKTNLGKNKATLCMCLYLTQHRYLDGKQKSTGNLPGVLGSRPPRN